MLALALLFCCQTPLPLPVEARFRLGAQALERGLLAEAARRFEDCQRAEPASAKYAFYRACAAARALEHELALAWLERARTNGFADAGLARFEPDLEPLRELPEFERWLAALPEPGAAGAPEVTLAFAEDFEPLLPSPDGERFLAGNFAPRLIDAETLEVLAVLPLSGRSLREQAWSPDGRAIATVDDDGRLQLWDGHTGELRGELPVEDGVGLSFSAVGTLLTSGSAGTLLWRWEDGEQLAEYAASGGSAIARLTRDGRRAMFVRDERLILWDVEHDLELHASPERGRFVPVGLGLLRLGRAPRFDARGDYAWYLARESGMARVLDARTGAVLLERSDDDATITSLAVAPQDGLVVVGDDAGWIRAIELADGRERWATRADPAFVSGVRVLSEGDRVLAQVHSPLRIFDPGWSPEGALLGLELTSGSERWRLPVEQAIFDGFAGFMPDGESFRFSDSGRPMEVRRIDDGELERRVERATRRAICAPLHSGSAALVSSADEMLRRLDLASARIELEAEAQPYFRLTVLPGDERAVGSIWDGPLELVDARSLERVATLAGTERVHSWPRRVIPSPDGARFATLGPPTSELQLWDAADGAPLGAIAIEGQAVRGAAWSPDGRWIACGTDQGVRVFDARTLAQRGGPLDHEGLVRVLAFQPDLDRLITVAADTHGRVWDLATGELVARFEHPDAFGEQYGSSIAFAPDGARFVTTTGSYGKIWCWDAESYEGLWMWKGDGGGAGTPGARFDPGGARAYFWQTVAHVFDAATGELLSDFGERGSGSLASRGDAQMLIRGRSQCISLYDPNGDRLRYSWMAFEDGEGLSFTANHYYAGDARPATRVQLMLPERSVPLDAYASQLYDPKRLRAAAAGVALAEPVLPTPPTLALARDTTRYLAPTDGLYTIELEARPGAHPLAGFEAERDGAPFDVEAFTDRTPAATSLRLVLDADALTAPTLLRIRVRDEAGVRSRVQRIALVP